MRRVLGVLAAVVAVLLVVVVANTLRFRSRQVAVAVAPAATLRPGVAERMAAALRFRTISHQDTAAFDAEPFRGLHRHLEESFPEAHRALRREVVGGFSLLFTWTGAAPQEPPILLLAHLDVVPAEGWAGRAWTHPPFAGTIADGYIWGRGALDDKAAVLGLLEAVDHLVADGFAPRRTVYLAFGHDEEIGGQEGATVIARQLAARGVRPEFVLDEGLAVADGVVAGVSAPVALVGIAEKGYLSLELVVESPGGHSSRPPPRTAVGILATAVDRLERHQAPAAIEGATRRLLEFAGPEMGFLNRMALANLWLFSPLVRRQLAATPETNALIRTTTAPTMLEGSVKDNVLPTRARAVVNFRIRPGDSVEGVVEHVRSTIDDERVAIAPLGMKPSEPSPEAAIDNGAFTTLQRTILEVFPGAVVAPSLVLGATDSRHYAGLTPNVYRFLPFRFVAEDYTRVHGIDERIAVADYERAVQFYMRLIRNAAR
jgi:carboxypeptidase PM20D1